VAVANRVAKAMSDIPLIEKLGIRPGQRMIILNSPPGFKEELVRSLPLGIEVVDKPEGMFDFVHLFVQNRAELERLGSAVLKLIKYDGMLWISYPKQTAGAKTDLTRNDGWDLMADAGLKAVTRVSVNDNWSALRFRPAKLVTY
jgi:hypothetical protein